MRILLRQKSGLGNQLFQYAAGLYFAKRYSGTLEILREPEERAVSFGQPRPFLLSKFSISAAVRSFSAVDLLLCSNAWAKRPVAGAARWVTRTGLYSPPFETDWIHIKELPVEPGMKRVYLNGYFQAHQYAAAVEDQLRRELVLREAASGKNLEVLDRIQSCDAPVSLHVRRGDYTKIYGGRDALPMTYYHNAIKAVHEEIADPTFFVFSDDIEYCRENLPKGERYVFVDHNGQADAHEDLRLMAACRHNVMANSTFSWWGAWLNANTDKRVIVPNRWLDSEIPHPHLLPSQWRRVEAEAFSAVRTEHPGHEQFSVA
jgi:hypothetical protein